MVFYISWSVKKAGTKIGRQRRHADNLISTQARMQTCRQARADMQTCRQITSLIHSLVLSSDVFKYALSRENRKLVLHLLDLVHNMAFSENISYFLGYVSE